MFTADYQLIDGDLLTEGRLELSAFNRATNRYVFLSLADSFDDHDAGIACFKLGFG